MIRNCYKDRKRKAQPTMLKILSRIYHHVVYSRVHFALSWSEGFKLTIKCCHPHSSQKTMNTFTGVVGLVLITECRNPPKRSQRSLTTYVYSWVRRHHKMKVIRLQFDKHMFTSYVYFFRSTKCRFRRQLQKTSWMVLGRMWRQYFLFW